MNELNDLLLPNEKKTINLDLKKINLALKIIGNPCYQIPAIQVAGTNGKGSIASFIESCLKAASIKVGCTTSPHLISWRERIRVNGKPISLVEFKKRLCKIKNLTNGIKLSTFELVIATALDHFSSHKVKLIILEVGLGGRLDATTAHKCRPLIAMGRIGLDHCEYLGNSLIEIAREKAAIIPPDSIVVSAKQDKEVKLIIEKKALEVGAKVKWVTPLSKDWKLGLHGQIQQENAAVALGILKELPKIGIQINEGTIREGLERANWPGRLEKKTLGNISLILDGAHNPLAAENLSKERENWVNQENGVFWILGIQKGKDAPKMLNHLLKTKDKAFLIPIPHQESWTKKQLSKNHVLYLQNIHQRNNLNEVFNEISMNYKHTNNPTVITGSLYLIGHLLTTNNLLSTN